MILIKQPSICALLTISALLSAGVGCADSADCGEGLKLVDDNCVLASGAGNGGDGDAGDAGVDGGAPARPSVDDGFKQACSDGEGHSDCTGVADYCALMPNTAMGTCTATGCLEDEGVCPPGWGCLDLGGFQPGLPSICREPSS